MIGLRTDGRPLVIGHRGAAGLAPENTLASLRAAVAAGADVVEFDVATGLLLAHSDREVPPESLTLDEAFAVLRPEQVGLHVDLKRIGIESEVVAAVRRHRLEERTLLSSTWPRALRRLAAIAPDLQRAIGYPRDRYGAAELRWPRPVTAAAAAAARSCMPARLPALLRTSRANVLALHHALVSAAVVRSAHARGVPVLAWTVNDPAAVARLAEVGLDGICTDDPEMALATLTSP